MPSERNLVEEYRQKLRNKISEQHSVSSRSKPSQPFNPMHPELPTHTVHHSAVSNQPLRVKERPMVPDELNQFPHDHPQHRQQVMDSIINKYSDHLPPQVRQSSPPKYNIYDQNLN